MKCASNLASIPVVQEVSSAEFTPAAMKTGMNAEMSEEDFTLVSLEHTFHCISAHTRFDKSLK